MERRGNALLCLSTWLGDTQQFGCPRSRLSGPLQSDAAQVDGAGTCSIWGGVTMGPGSPQERPKSAVFANETKVKMSVEEQIDRMKRHQSGSMKEKRRSLQLPGSQQPDTPGTKAPASYKVVSPCTHTAGCKAGVALWGGLRSLKEEKGHPELWQGTVGWVWGLSRAGVPAGAPASQHPRGGHL